MVETSHSLSHEILGHIWILGHSGPPPILVPNQSTHYTFSFTASFTSASSQPREEMMVRKGEEGSQMSS